MESRQANQLSDQELDAYVLTRLRMAGVDIAVLPEDDAEAPVDQKRILSSARRFLRSTPAALLDFEMDVQTVPPVMYPSADQARGRAEG